MLFRPSRAPEVQDDFGHPRTDRMRSAGVPTGDGPRSGGFLPGSGESVATGSQGGVVAARYYHQSPHRKPHTGQPHESVLLSFVDTSPIAHEGIHSGLGGVVISADLGVVVDSVAASSRRRPGFSRADLATYCPTPGSRSIPGPDSRSHRDGVPGVVPGLVRRFRSWSRQSR